MKQEATLIPRPLEDAARGSHRRHPLFDSPDYGAFYGSGFRSGPIL
jgi:hypothetical protein